LRTLVELISLVQQQLARWLDGGGVRLADGTQLAVAGYPGCQQRSEFAGFARYGYSKSHHRFVWGVRLVLLTDERGLPLGYTIVPANEKEYEPLADLLTGTPAKVVIADKGLWVAATRHDSPPTTSGCSLPTGHAPPPTSAGSVRSPRSDW
jgi:Transposase DDE domain